MHLLVRAELRSLLLGLSGTLTLSVVRLFGQKSTGRAKRKRTLYGAHLLAFRSVFESIPCQLLAASRTVESRCTFRALMELTRDGFRFVTNGLGIRVEKQKVIIEISSEKEESYIVAFAALGASNGVIESLRIIVYSK